MTISVVIPVYNQQIRIGRAVRSALSNRKFCDVEIIVVDDASTDHTIDELKGFGDSIKVLKNLTNEGLPSSLNKAIKFSSGKYIFRLDSDDWIHPRTLITMATVLDLNNRIDAVASDYLIVNDRQQITEYQSSFDVPIGCSIMFRREHLISIGLYDVSQLWHEDKELMSRFNEKYQIFHLPIPFYRYYRHDSNMTLDQQNMEYYHQLLLRKTSP